jgi:hypothetical protein
MEIITILAGEVLLLPCNLLILKLYQLVGNGIDKLAKLIKWSSNLYHHFCQCSFNIFNSILFGLKICLIFVFQDGRIDYNEFVAMMQKGNANLGKKGLQSSFSIGFREALSVY